MTSSTASPRPAADSAAATGPGWRESIGGIPLKRWVTSAWPPRAGCSSSAARAERVVRTSVSVWPTAPRMPSPASAAGSRSAPGSSGAQVIWAMTPGPASNTSSSRSLRSGSIRAAGFCAPHRTVDRKGPSRWMPARSPSRTRGAQRAHPGRAGAPRGPRPGTRRPWCCRRGGGVRLLCGRPRCRCRTRRRCRRGSAGRPAPAGASAPASSPRGPWHPRAPAAGSRAHRHTGCGPRRRRRRRRRPSRTGSTTLPVSRVARSVRPAGSAMRSREDDGPAQVPGAIWVDSRARRLRQAQAVQAHEVGHRVDVAVLEVRAGRPDVLGESLGHLAEGPGRAARRWRC